MILLSLSTFLMNNNQKKVRPFRVRTHTRTLTHTHTLIIIPMIQRHYTVSEKNPRTIHGCEEDKGNNNQNQIIILL